jgi:DNA-binding PucR family transcriptional regulator
VSVVEAAATSDAEPELRDQLSTLRALLVLSMLMTETTDEGQILHLATTCVPSLGRCRVGGVHLHGAWQAPTSSGLPTAARRQLEPQLAALGTRGGQLSMGGQGWAWAFPLRGTGGHAGHLIIGASEPPTKTEQFLLRALVQQTGAAIGNARLHAKERATSNELKRTNLAREQTIGALERTMQIHARLTRVAVEAEGQEGIARAIHELTGYPVAVEDRFGNLRAWAGPNRPDPYPKDTPARREQLLGRAREGRPVRAGGRLFVVARPRDDILGVLALVDPAGTAGGEDLVALEHGATVLAMELARLRSLAEAELRLRRDLVEELLGGTDDDMALARAQALGYDLERPHRVVVVEGQGRTADDEQFFHAVRRAARDHDVGSLIVARGDAVVVLADGTPSWENFRAAVLAELGGGRCRIGVGGPCERPGEFPRSYREAQLALKVQRTTRGREGATVFGELGVYRILSELQDPATLERFVRDLLGPLLDYDARKGSELVRTLTQYLECGGNWDATAAALSLARSSFKYRLQRIRELLGHDFADPETQFNLQLATRAWQILQSLRA